jgi:predicted DNA-binding transcriptional regulator AlpA
MIQLEALLPIGDLSKQLGLNKYTIYQKIRKNKFPKGVKLNGRRLFKTTEIEEYLQSLNIQSKVTV